MEIGRSSQNSTNTDSKYSSERMLSGPKSNRIKKRPHISYNEENVQVDYLMCAQSIVCDTPEPYQEISSRDDRDQWKLAIKNEIDSLLINKTWTLVPRPEDKNIVG